MAWQVETSYENQYRPSIDVNPEDKALYKEMQKKFREDQDLWTIIDVGINRGFAYPLPERPIRMQVSSDHKVMPNFLNAWISWAIPRRIIDIIEAFEPGVHRYWPVDLRLKDGTPTEPRWLLNVCNRLDTIVVEASDVGVVKNPLGEPTQLVPRFGLLEVKHKGSGPEHLVMSKDKIGDHALWCEYRFQGARFLSNGLAQAFQEAGMQGLEFALETKEI